MTLLEVQNLEATYGPIKALRGVSLQVGEGQIVTVLGPNGAGKTTLLKILSGLLDPRRGAVLLQGQAIGGLDPAMIVRQGLIQVPEGREVFPLLTVRQNLMLGAYTRSDRDAVARDLAQAHAYFPILKERADQPAGLLSGGQQQMLAIARALMAAPRMLMLDEPSLGLSPKLTQEIFTIIRRINQERGTPILLVEQNAHLALHLADQAYILENGRVVLEGPCESLRQRPDIQEFYLGVHDAGSRGERRWKRRKGWH